MYTISRYYLQQRDVLRDFPTTAAHRYCVTNTNWWTICILRTNAQGSSGFYQIGRFSSSKSILCYQSPKMHRILRSTVLRPPPSLSTCTPKTTHPTCANTAVHGGAPAPSRKLSPGLNLRKESQSAIFRRLWSSRNLIVSPPARCRCPCDRRGRLHILNRRGLSCFRAGRAILATSVLCSALLRIRGKNLVSCKLI